MDKAPHIAQHRLVADIPFDLYKRAKVFSAIAGVGIKQMIHTALFTYLEKNEQMTMIEKRKVRKM
jgi:hypothetical protein